MKITIDTKEDSHEDIRKVIRMLSSLIGQGETFSNQPNIFDNSSDAETNAFASMFGTQSDTSKSDDEIKPDDKEDIPPVVEYL